MEIDGSFACHICASLSDQVLELGHGVLLLLFLSLLLAQKVYMHPLVTFESAHHLPSIHASLRVLCIYSLRIRVSQAFSTIRSLHLRVIVKAFLVFLCSVLFFY